MIVAVPRMCLIGLDWKPEESPSLMLAANRDEFYERPSRPAQYWEDDPHIYGGKDLLQGGSWMCCSTTARCAAVTNFFAKEDRGKKYPKSRGNIVTDFVGAKVSSEEFARDVLEPAKTEYGGFSAFLFDGKSLVYCSNRDSEQFWRKLSPGTYGLSNHLLDTPWPKVQKIKAIVAQSRNEKEPERLARQLLMELENEERVEERSQLPSTLTKEEEFLRSAISVKSEYYGTRTSTVVTFAPGEGFHFTEKNHETVSNPLSSFSHEFVAIK